MQSESKQFENWITNESALSEQDIAATRKVMHTLHSVKLYLSGRHIHCKTDHLIDLTRMVLEQTCKDT